MPERHVSVPILRDVLLVALVAAIAFALGVAAAGYGAGLESSDPAATGGGGESRGATLTRVAAFGSRTSPTTPARQPRLRATVDLPRPDAANRPETAPVVPAERFSGDGAGRRETAIVQDPHNRRAYIMETASLLHRRGWIGLDEHGATTTSGDAGPAILPGAIRSPR